jgi:hypothetical protein
MHAYCVFCGEIDLRQVKRGERFGEKRSSHRREEDTKYALNVNRKVFSSFNESHAAPTSKGRRFTFEY